MTTLAVDRTWAPTNRARTHYASARQFRQLMGIVGEFGGELGRSFDPHAIDVTFTHGAEFVKGVVAYDRPSGNICLVVQIARVPSNPRSVRASLANLQATSLYSRFDSDDEVSGTIILHAATPCRLDSPGAEHAVRGLLADFTRVLWDARLRAVLSLNEAQLCVRCNETGHTEQYTTQFAE